MTNPAPLPFPKKKRIDPGARRPGHSRNRTAGARPKALRVEPPVFVCCGEDSGDLYAGLVIGRLKRQKPALEVLAVGGAHLEAAGARIVQGFDRLRAFGLTDALSSLRAHYQTYQAIGRAFARRRVRTFVAVAYPGLNLPLCRLARRHNMRVLYLLPPQIWAWAGWRESLLRRWADLLISVFPFEAQHLEKLGLRTVCLGNPLVAQLRAFRRNDFGRRIGFMPGSRPRQIARHLGVVTALAGAIKARQPGIDLCLIAAREAEARSLARAQDVLAVRYQDRYQWMKNCDLLITSTGTASLEAAAMAIPQIFFHRPSFLDYHILRRFVKVREFNLANLYYGRPVVECYIGWNQGALRRQLEMAIRERAAALARS